MVDVRTVDMTVKIGNVTLKNPIMPASGAFSTDLAQVMDINRLGALVAKTVSREFRIGNPPPRVAELECGMINSIGLPTKGIEYFLSHQVPDYKRFTPPLVASISAQTADDFAAMTSDVDVPDVDIIEVNISCPTRNPGGGNFAMHEDHTFAVMSRIRKMTKKPVWAKLSPNAGDVVAIAKAAESAGADAFFTCGSNRLMQLMKRLAKAHGIPGQVAMEQVMACGLGPCYVCVRTFEVDGKKELRRVCIEGPVFDLQEACGW